MTPQLKALALQMSGEYCENEWQSNYVYVVRTAYLAGFEARDGIDARLREEHAEMAKELKGAYNMLHNMNGCAFVATRILNLMTKIESK